MFSSPWAKVTGRVEWESAVMSERHADGTDCQTNEYWSNTISDLVFLVGDCHDWENEDSGTDYLIQATDENLFEFDFKSGDNLQTDAVWDFFSVWISGKDTSSWSSSIGLARDSVIWIVVIDGIWVGSENKSSSKESSQVLTDPVEWKLVPVRSTSETEGDSNCWVQMSAWITR